MKNKYETYLLFVVFLVKATHSDCLTKKINNK